MTGPLYHWSPRSRRASIETHGLLTHQESPAGPVYHGFSGEDEGMGEYRQPSLSFSPDPITAWAYSNEVWDLGGVWDLWQVWPSAEDEVNIHTTNRDRIVEVRIYNSIPPGRVRYVGERSA